MEELKEVELSRSHFDYLGMRKGGLQVGDSVCPGDHHSPGKQIRHEIIAVHNGFAIVKMVEVQSRWDKTIGKYKIRVA